MSVDDDLVAPRDIYRAALLYYLRSNIILCGLRLPNHRWIRCKTSSVSFPAAARWNYIDGKIGLLKPWLSRWNYILSCLPTDARISHTKYRGQSCGNCRRSLHRTPSSVLKCINGFIPCFFCRCQLMPPQKGESQFEKHVPRAWNYCSARMQVKGICLIN